MPYSPWIYQFREPSRHSCKRPIIRIIRNNEVLIIDILVFKIIVIGRGINRIISISKTRKITASRKNRRENGIRAEDFGSKPHSNGVDFSRSVFFFNDRVSAAVITIIGKMVANIIVRNEVIILLVRVIIGTLHIYISQQGIRKLSIFNFIKVIRSVRRYTFTRI